MSQHPQVHVYFKKEAHFFHKPPSFVLNPVSWFSYLRGYQALTPRDMSKGVILGDHTPGYVWRIPWNCKQSGQQRFGCAGRPFPLNTTAMNIQRQIPHAKLIVLVRDPIDRAFSHFHHFYDPNKCRPQHPGKTPECFHDHIKEQIASLRQCWVKHGSGAPFCAWGPVDEDAWQQDRRVLSLGLYGVFLAEWLKLFPREQFCMVDLESFKVGIDHGMRLIEGLTG